MEQRETPTCPLTIPKNGKSIIFNDEIKLSNRTKSLTDIRSLSDSPRGYMRWLIKRNAKKLYGG